MAADTHTALRARPKVASSRPKPEVGLFEIVSARADASGKKTTKDDTVDFLKIYRAAPVERINVIKAGLSAAVAKAIIGHLSIGHGRGLEALKLSAATVNRKAAQNATLSSEDSERVVGMARLIGQAQAMVEESGDPAGFDAAAWTSRWLQEPLPAFGGARPIDFMDTMEGQAMVSQVLAQTQSGAYA